MTVKLADACKNEQRLQNISAYQFAVMTSYVPTPEQIAQYHKDGFLILRVQEHGLVDPQQLQQWTAEVRSWPKEHGKWMPYEEVNSNGEAQLMRTENFVDYHQK